MTTEERAERIAGVIVGTAVGDSLGLPREGLSPRRAARRFGPPPLRHAFFLGRGMVSDDTEHLCMTGQAYLHCPHIGEAFARSLAWRLRCWLLGLPAGVGLATLRSICKLWLGFSPNTSGVRSAGNGPAMRAAILGVCLGNDPERLRAYVKASTRLTHSDVRAERGAMLVALAAHRGAMHGPQGTVFHAFHDEVLEYIPDMDQELRSIFVLIEKHLQIQAPAEVLARNMGLQRGITGYMYHTVPLVLYCWLLHRGTFRPAVEEVIALGGDADSTGAILGGIAGATVGLTGIPSDWITGLCEWPRSVSWMRTLAQHLAEAENANPGPVALFWPGLFLRNAFFLALILAHGFRRCLPPY